LGILELRLGSAQGQVRVPATGWQPRCGAGVRCGKCPSTLCLKKDTTQPPSIISTIVVRFQKFLVQILLSTYAIERWFDMPPHLFIVRPLPWKTLRPRKITSSAVKEHVFELLVFYLSITFVSHTRSQ